MIAPKGKLIEDLVEARTLGEGNIIIRRTVPDNNIASIKEQVFFYPTVETEVFEADLKALFLEAPHSVVGFQVTGSYQVNFGIQLIKQHGELTDES